MKVYSICVRQGVINMARLLSQTLYGGNRVPSVLGTHRYSSCPQCLCEAQYSMLCFLHLCNIACDGGCHLFVFSWILQTNVMYGSIASSMQHGSVNSNGHETIGIKISTKEETPESGSHVEENTTFVLALYFVYSGLF